MVPTDQLAFHLQAPLSGTASAVIFEFFKYPLLYTLIALIVIVLLMIVYRNLTKSLKVEFLGKKVFPCKIRRWFINAVFCSCTVYSLFFLFSHMDVKEFILNQYMESNFIQDHYVEYNSDDVTFPKDKQNLIYIYLESMEATYNNDSNNYIPNLTSIANDNVDLSFGDNKFYQITGATWTIASMVAQTSGLPLKFSMQSDTYNVESNSFLNGVPTLGEILADNGYKNYLYIGSDSVFAARDLYFENHGDYEIFDYKKAKEEKFIEEDYDVFWGYEDKKLFEYSKGKLLEISKKKEPFNFTILTVDTHSPEGYLDETCDIQYNTQLENVLSCSDKMVNDFVKWIQKQDFYKMEL